MSDINRVIIIGRLTKDVDLRYTQGGSSVAGFSIASNYTYVSNGEKKDIVSYFNCTAWGKLGETISTYCKKGHRIGLEGRLQQRTWQDQNGFKRSAVEIVVEGMQFLQPKSKEIQDEDPGASLPGVPSGDVHPFSDNDIPF